MSSLISDKATASGPARPARSSSSSSTSCEGRLYGVGALDYSLKDRRISGAIVGFAKVTRDLTERRRAELALRRSQEQFRLLVQGVTDYAIYMLDVNGAVGYTLGAGAIVRINVTGTPTGLYVSLSKIPS